MRRIRPIAERFWEKVEKSEGCWLWTASTSQGYGRLGLGRRGDGWAQAHRFSWELHIGPVEPRLFVLHRCDNRRCVRPDHLFVGTQLDNIRDMYAKGRQSKVRALGERHAQSKLTGEQVTAIRLANESQRALGRQYGVSRAAIKAIRQRRTWCHL